MIFVKESIDKIYWKKEAKRINLNWEQWLNIYNTIISEGYSKQVNNFNRSEWMTGNSYKVDRRGHYAELYTRNPKFYKEYGTNYVVFFTNEFDNEKNTGELIENKGEKHLKELNNKFKLKNKLSLRKAFGYTDKEFLRCVPRQLAYSNRNLMKRVLNHISSIDGCSQYLSNCLGRLPDSHTAITVKGIVKPNEEYPFAFYLKSGHCAEYGVFDSHDWLNQEELFTELFRMRPSDKEIDRQSPFAVDEETVLMKAGEFEITDELKEIFNRKANGDKEAKEAYVTLIGQMHNKQQQKDKFQHIAAIAIGRSNSKMLEYVNKIGCENIVQICVDGIIYKSDKVYGESTKGTGVMYQEYTDKQGYVYSINRYIIKDGSKFIKEKHSGVELDQDGNEINLETIKDLTDCKYWKRDNTYNIEIDNIIKKELLNGTR